jgi:hypothetical protein
MKLYILEGTTDEISEVLAKHDLKSGPSEAATSKAIVPDNPKNSERWVTAEEAHTILTRRPLSRNVTVTMKALCEAGEKRLTSDKLKKLTGQGTHQFRGMMGAFGRRISYSAPNAMFFDSKWDHESGQFNWRLPESVRQVIRKLKIA